MPKETKTGKKKETAKGRRPSGWDARVKALAKRKDNQVVSGGLPVKLIPEQFMKVVDKKKKATKKKKK